MATIKDFKGNEHQFDIDGLRPDDVVSVYSGKKDHCCCGCSGKHTYNSMHLVEAAEHGYVAGERANVRAVKRIIDIIKAASPDSMRISLDSYVSCTVGNRFYVAYFTKAKVATNAVNPEVESV